MKPQLRFPLRRQLKLSPQYLQLPRQPLPRSVPLRSNRLRLSRLPCSMK